MQAINIMSDPLYRPGQNPDYPDSVSEHDFERAFPDAEMEDEELNDPE